MPSRPRSRVDRDGTILDVVEHAEPKGLLARLLEAINPPE